MTARETPYVEAQLAELRAEFPTHDVWFVRALVPPSSWCSRPKGHPTSTIVTDSSEDLRARILAELLTMRHPTDRSSVENGHDGSNSPTER